MMRRSFVVLLLLGSLACATATNSGQADVDLQIEQLPDAGFNVQDQGATSVAYQAVVQNRSSEPVTLSKIEMRALDRSPYSLRSTPVELNETIAAGEKRTVPFTMWSYRRAQRTTARATVWVTGTAYFQSAKGNLRKDFTQSFSEPQ